MPRFWTSATIQNSKYAIFKKPHSEKYKMRIPVTTLFCPASGLAPHNFRGQLLTPQLLSNCPREGQMFILGEMYSDLHTFRPINFEYWAKSSVFTPHFAQKTSLCQTYSSVAKKHLMIVLISTFGMEHNKHSLGLVEKILTLDDLF